jgi:hypothetical protein
MTTKNICNLERIAMQKKMYSGIYISSIKAHRIPDYNQGIATILIYIGMLQGHYVAVLGLMNASSNEKN